MQIILITTIVITVIGIIVAAALVFVSNRFHVEADERVTAIREALPGNNCGACGYAGCDAMSEAIASGEAPVNACPVDRGVKRLFVIRGSGIVRRGSWLKL